MGALLRLAYFRPHVCAGINVLLFIQVCVLLRVNVCVEAFLGSVFYQNRVVLAVCQGF